MCVLEDSYKDVKLNYTVCVLFTEDSKKAVSEQNFHTVSLGWDIWEFFVIVLQLSHRLLIISQ